MNETSPFMVFSGTNSRYLAERICASLNCPLGNMNITHFADGEFAVSYEESIRGAIVFLVQSTFPNSDNLMELLLMIDAAKRASAKSIVAVIPYFGWARQDRKDKPRVSIGAKLVADLLSVAGIDRLITMDLHADQIQGFFDVPVDHLYASSVFIPYIESLNLGDNLVMASPDVGGSKRAGAYAKYFDVPLVLCNKTREKANVVASMQVIGDVKDKDVILIDDIICSGEQIDTVLKQIDFQKYQDAGFYIAACAIHDDGMTLLDEKYSHVKYACAEHLTKNVSFLDGVDYSFPVTCTRDILDEFYKNMLKEKGFGARKPYGIIGMGLNYAFDKSVPNDCIAVLHLHNKQFNGLLKKRGS